MPDLAKADRSWLLQRNPAFGVSEALLDCPGFFSIVQV